jgi:hypothetical protein
VKKAQPMSTVGFPLLLIPFAIYNIIAFLMPSVSFSEPLVRLTLVSGAEWPISLSDVLLTLGILLLLLEVMRGARPGGKFLTDHLLALLVFGGSAAQFVMWPKFGTSTYFLLVLMAMVDFLAGIALRGGRASRVQPASRGAVARGDAKGVDIKGSDAKTDDAKTDDAKGGDAKGGNIKGGDAKEAAAEQSGTAPAELPREPASTPAPASPAAAPTPASELPSATSVAESVLIDSPEPKVAQPAAASEPEPATASESVPVEKAEPKSEPASIPAAANDPSPQVVSPPPDPSPELQPGSGAPVPSETPKH